MPAPEELWPGESAEYEARERSARERATEHEAQAVRLVTPGVFAPPKRDLERANIHALLAVAARLEALEAGRPRGED